MHPSPNTSVHTSEYINWFIILRKRSEWYTIFNMFCSNLGCGFPPNKRPLPLVWCLRFSASIGTELPQFSGSVVSFLLGGLGEYLELQVLWLKLSIWFVLGNFRDKHWGAAWTNPGALSGEFREINWYSQVVRISRRSGWQCQWKLWSAQVRDKSGARVLRNTRTHIQVADFWMPTIQYCSQLSCLERQYCPISI